MAEQKKLKISLSPRLLEIRTKQHGKMVFSALQSFADLEFVARVLTDEALKDDPRALTVRVLHHQLKRPPLDEDALGSWSDRVLARVARVYAADRHGLSSPFDEPDARTYVCFRNALERWRKRQQQQMAEALKPLTTAYSDFVGDFAERLKDLTRPTQFLRSIPAITFPTHHLAALQEDLSGYQRYLDAFSAVPALPVHRSYEISPSSLDYELVDTEKTARDTPSTSLDTPWATVERQLERMRDRLTGASAEEDYQSVGHLAREVTISVAQAVYIPEKHKSVDGITPSTTDAKRMLEAFVAVELPGKSNTRLRKFARAVFDQANEVQHDRTATSMEAGVCVEGTLALVNIVSLIARGHNV